MSAVARLPRIVPPAPPRRDPDLLTLPEVCHYLGLGVTKVKELVAAGSLPKPLKFGTASRWSVRRQLEPWVDEQVAARDK